MIKNPDRKTDIKMDIKTEGKTLGFTAFFLLFYICFNSISTTLCYISTTLKTRRSSTVSCHIFKAGTDSALI